MDGQMTRKSCCSWNRQVYLEVQTSDAEQQIPTMKWAALQQPRAHTIKRDNADNRSNERMPSNTIRFQFSNPRASQHNDKVESIHVGPHWRWPNQVPVFKWILSFISRYSSFLIVKSSINWAIITLCSITSSGSFNKYSIQGLQPPCLGHLNITLTTCLTKEHVDSLMKINLILFMSWYCHMHCFPAPLVHNKVNFPVFVQWYM